MHTYSRRRHFCFVSLTLIIFKKKKFISLVWIFSPKKVFTFFKHSAGLLPKNSSLVGRQYFFRILEQYDLGSSMDQLLRCGKDDPTKKCKWPSYKTSLSTSLKQWCTKPVACKLQVQCSGWVFDVQFFSGIKLSSHFYLYIKV